MQARSKVLASAIALSALVTACGGGEEEETAHTPELRSHTVQAEATAAKAKMRVPISSLTETFGAEILSVYWDVEPLRDAVGGLLIADEDCTKGEKSTRLVPNSDKVIARWSCPTSVMAIEGAKGDFEVTAIAELSTGAVKKASFIFTASK